MGEAKGHRDRLPTGYLEIAPPDVNCLPGPEPAEPLNEHKTLVTSAYCSAGSRDLPDFLRGHHQIRVQMIVVSEGLCLQRVPWIPLNKSTFAGTCECCSYNRALHTGLGPTLPLGAGLARGSWNQ